MRWVGILYRLHVNLYAVSAINHKSFTALCCIGGHWQVKTEKPYYCQSLCLIFKHFTRIAYSATLVLYGCLGRTHLHFVADTTTLYTLHTTPYTLHTTHYTLHSTPSSINHKPQLRCIFFNKSNNYLVIKNKPLIFAVENSPPRKYPPRKSVKY